MSQQRYHQVDSLAQVALNLSVSQRQAFLKVACEGDDELLTQVNALVRSYESLAEFLEAPAFETWARDVASEDSNTSLEGREVGRYLVLQHLGSGGIGDVWLARDKELSREVALKFLSAGFAGDSDQLRRFRQEARAASTLNHPNLVTVFDIGEFEGQQFIAQEYVHGKTVRETLRDAPIALSAAIDIAKQIASALAAAHGAGVVHRDIKPENIMIRPDGLVKVLDFGLARFIEDAAIVGLSGEHSGLTRPGIILGTARYMSPEQARGLPVDGRSDIFSLGVVLYEILTGAAPFTGNTPSDVLAAILTVDPAPLSRSSRNVPAEFERIVRKCLAKEPAARYASAQALYEDLKQLAEKLNRPARRERWAALALGAIAALASVYYLADQKQPAPSFGAMQITRVATHGDVADVAVSRDGTMLAYVQDEGSVQSVWVRDISGANEHIVVKAEAANLSSVQFSPDNSYLYYRRRGAEDIGDLYRVAVKAGAPQRILGEVSGAAALSPDGRRIAFVRLKPASWEASLIVSSADGSSETTLATLRRPQYFDEHGVAWSPDGRSIACFTGEATHFSQAAFHLVEIHVADRSQHMITEQPWAWPQSVAWSARGDALIVTAQSRGNAAQLWMVQHKGGEVTRLTNDLSNYGRVTLTGDGTTLSTIQTEVAVGLWAAGATKQSPVVPIPAAPLHSGAVGIAWTPDAHIVYSDSTGNYRDLWTIDPDYGSSHRLSTGLGNKDQAAVSSNGRYIVYMQDGNLWRSDADGTNARQLTHGPLDVHPDIGADGQTVVFASFADWSPGIGGEPTLWRASIDGGKLAQISPQAASYPRLSPDGKQLGCIYFSAKDPRISTYRLALLRSDGTGGFTVFQSPPSAATPISWSPGRESLDYIVNQNGIGNIWRQPLDGGAPFRVTNFDRDELYSFSWSKTGRLACARGTTTRSIILIESFH
jgi:Tol biopolymer transport system component